MSTLFNGDTPQIDPNKNYLEELVGEGKKYRDPQALAFSKVHADTTIETLKRELAEAQTELQTRKRLEELLTEATHKQSPVVDPNPVNPDPVRTDMTNDLSAEKIEQLISERLNQHESTRTASENVRVVKEKLSEKFGNGYEEIARKAAEAAGVTLEWLQNQAQTNPKVVLSLVEANAPKKEVFSTPPHNRLNPDIAPEADVRNWSYYQKVKARDPKYYESAKVQNQMEADALRLGAQFFV